MTAGLLILDLDGTLCLGDEPVLRYARAAFEGVADPSAAVGRVEAFLAGGEAVGGARDGYQVVAAIARELGVEHENLGAAFRWSRADVEEWIDAVWAPPGIGELLGGLTGVRRILVTNSPAEGMGRLLDALGVRSVLDGVVTEAGKPAGMPAALDTAQASAPGAALASLGDIWRNDHAEVRARGGATFLIDRFGLGDGEPTARADRVELLFPAIVGWAAELPV